MAEVIMRFKEGFGEIILNEGDVFSREEGIFEVVISTYYEGKRLIRFRAVRRGKGEERGAILESGYAITSQGELEQSFSGIYHWRNTPPFKRSARYPELNKFLKKRRK